jgi:hypothetical protein
MALSGSGRAPAPQRQPASVVDVLDRVLEKGVVVIATIGVSVVGLRLIDLDARVVVSSIDTYLSRADTIEAVAHARPLLTRPAAAPAVSTPPGRPRRIRGRRQPARWRPVPVADVIRCRDGCTFGRDTITLSAGTFACPYRRGVRCRLGAA